MPHGKTHKDDFLGAYVEYAKALRTWFVAFGIGVPVFILTHSNVGDPLRLQRLDRSIAIACLIGVGFQVLLASLNKMVMWALYYGEIQASFRGQRLYRVADTISSWFWIDIGVDGLTFSAFGWAIWKLLIAIGG